MNKNGCAMVTVILLITVFVILGMAMLALARRNARESAAVLMAEKSYYAAESAAQVGAQALAAALRDAASPPAFASLARADIEAELTRVFGTVAPAGTYNGIEGVTFEALKLHSFPQGTPGESVTFGVEVSAKAAGRAVSAFVNMKVSKASGTLPSRAYTICSPSAFFSARFIPTCVGVMLVAEAKNFWSFMGMVLNEPPAMNSAKPKSPPCAENITALSGYLVRYSLTARYTCSNEVLFGFRTRACWRGARLNPPCGAYNSPFC